VLDEATVFQVLLPPRDHVAALAELGTCEVAVGERLFEVLPRLDVVGRLPLLDLLGNRTSLIISGIEVMVVVPFRYRTDEESIPPSRSIYSTDYWNIVRVWVGSPSCCCCIC
jgi:hypothetical protein